MSEAPDASAHRELEHVPIVEIGRGGMATVFLVGVRRPHGITELKVLKQLREDLCDDRDYIAMFRDEAKVAVRMKHPNIVETYEFGAQGKNHFIVMEYLDGQSLEEVTRRAVTMDPTGLPLALYLRILCEALRGLHYAHELCAEDGSPLKLVHRDVSPHNVFLTYSGQVKLVDFGIAKFVGSKHETMSGVVKGRAAYMAPERFVSARVDRRADVFAVGAILWGALAGRRLWRGLNEIEVLHRVTTSGVPFPSTVKPGIEPGIEAICMKALATDPDMRHQTASELREDLEAYLDRIGDRTSTQTIATCVQQLFQDQRTRIAGTIDARLKEAVSLVCNDLSLWEAPRLPLVSDPSVQQPSPVSIPPETPFASSLPQAQPQGDDTSNGVSGTRAEATPPGVEPMEARPSSSRAGYMFFVGLTAAVACGTVLAVQLAPAPPAPGLAEAASSRVELRVRLSPPEARLFVDDHPADAVQQFPRDGALHRVRAEASGYAARTMLVAFDQAVQEVTVALTAEPSAALQNPPAASSVGKDATTIPAEDPKRAPRPRSGRPRK